MARVLMSIPAWGCLGLTLLGLCWTLTAQDALAGDAPRFVQPGSRAAALGACVESTAFMRRNHMELIKHQRDATVHQGIRGTRYSLAGCIDCHVSHTPDGQPVAVNEKQQFCSACHAFAAVKVDCFDCHSGVPRGGPARSSGGQGGGVPEGDLRGSGQ
ncbi:sulfur reduction protein DsrJ [uncultured Thiodictyon sp.]|uniref:sulfur reduction protein DsrJ n=1 Tax=uncultured Thiodictyon sp. TaxID=1846217 RepID=UPI0025FAD630|nr:sulfur reduction protein DsrJ [uncultured Thiodictyon sp.]